MIYCKTFSTYHFSDGYVSLNKSNIFHINTVFSLSFSLSLFLHLHYKTMIDIEMWKCKKVFNVRWCWWCSICDGSCVINWIKYQSVKRNVCVHLRLISVWSKILKEKGDMECMMILSMKIFVFDQISRIKIKLIKMSILSLEILNRPYQEYTSFYFLLKSKIYQACIDIHQNGITKYENQYYD